MKQTITRVVCDKCDRVHSEAIVTCKVHRLDLCEYHMRKHFVPACRLKPVEREPRTQDRTRESLDRISKTLADQERRRGNKKAR
jgi:hypothetical protein